MASGKIFLIAFIVLASKSTLPAEANPINVDNTEVCDIPSCRESAQLLLDAMNTSVDPCNDFYRYACGGWIARHPIPDDKAANSAAAMLSDQVNEAVAELLKTATEHDNPKPVLDAAIIFQGCMDEESRERAGLDPLKDLLDYVGGWPMAKAKWSHVGYQWQTEVATMIRMLITPAIISVLVMPDSRDSSRNIIILNEPTFGISRDLLIDPFSSERNQEIIAGYKDYIIAAAKLLNPSADETQLANDADEIIQFESQLAQFTRPDLEKKDPSAWYHKMTVSEVESITENNYFEWMDFLNNVFEDFPLVTDDTEVILREINYIKNAIKLAHDTDSRILANYIGWILTKEYGKYTTKNFRDTGFRFNVVMTGIETPEKMEPACAKVATELLEQAVGRLYVDKYFPEQEKHGAEDIIDNIRAVYEETLRNNPWIDQDTKEKAIEKLKAMVNMVGYPPWIRNDEELNNYYSSMPIVDKNEFFTSYIATREAGVKMLLKTWNEPTHRTTQWITAPSEVNAFHNPAANTIIFPAAILHLPFYKYGRALPLNYGAVGSVVAHEISHAFDDQGSQYDKEGNLVNWWSEETKEKFDQKTTCFKVQYSSQVESVTQMHLNGNMTIGDDIADNGGIRNAFIAYKMRALQLDGVEPTANKRLPGVQATPDQLFFLGYANAYCSHMREDYLPMQIQYSDHTLDEFRVVVPLSNSRAFADAFNCPRGSHMNPESKCVLW